MFKFRYATIGDATDRDSLNQYLPGNFNVKTWVFDPPYNVGLKYDAYDDNIEFDEYKDQIKQMAETMYYFTKNGNLMLINYQEQCAKLFDTILSTGWKFKQWITWCYPSNIGMSKNKFTRASRGVIWFTKGKPEFYPENHTRPYKNPNDKRIKKLIDSGKTGCTHYDWWEINMQKNVGKEYAGYSNQLPRELIERIILTTTKEYDVVGDITAGSGTTGKVAKDLNRNYWINDINEKSVDYWNFHEIKWWCQNEE